jgi:hypothetical protein
MLIHHVRRLLAVLCMLLPFAATTYPAGPFSPADAFLGILYRNDGALDEQGRYTLFARPDQFFTEPGLNCSGLVVAISRDLLGRNFTLAEAKRDRLGDSGPGAALGEDWDFGRDLILNLTDGLPRRQVLPGGNAREPVDGLTDTGFLVNDPAVWPAVLAQLTPGRVYLGSLNRPVAKEGYLLLHHHVVLLLPGHEGQAWLYQATGRHGVYRLDLATAEGLRRFLEPYTAHPRQRLLLIEAIPPER